MSSDTHPAACVPARRFSVRNVARVAFFAVPVANRLAGGGRDGAVNVINPHHHRNPFRLFTAPGHATPLTIPQIASLAGCAASHAYRVVREGGMLAGYVWTPASEIDAPRGRARRMLVSDNFPGKTFSQDDVRAMGKLAQKTPLQPYVKKGYRIGGHVWRWATEWCDSRNPVLEDASPPKPAPAWHKPVEDQPTASSPEPRRWVFAWDAEAQDLFPKREQLPRLDSGAAKVNGGAA